MPSLPAKIKVLSILAKPLDKQILNFSCSALFHMETGVSLKYFVNGCRSFNRSGTTEAVELDTSKAFNRVWHAILLHKCKSYGIWPYFFFSQ